MPLINGQKMACEPCIRGHRSTKCTHASERLMVPVRKPGRPLSSCPHPSSRPCTCGAVTAAIPRKQKCSCGPSNGTTAPKQEPEEPSSETTSPSDTRSSNGNYRVQKAPRRGSTRKSPIDPAGLERMDASQLNVLSNYDGAQAPMGMPHHSVAGMGGVHAYGNMGVPPAENTFAHPSMMYPVFPQQMPPAMMPPGSTQPTTNGHASPTSNGVAASNTTSAKGGCCGGGTNGANKDDPTTSRESSASIPENETADKKTKSCCSSNHTDSASKVAPETSNQPPMAHQPQMMMPHYPVPFPMANGMYPFFPHPTVFTYPPQYGTYMQPLQPDQWRQVMAAFSYGQPPTANGFPVPSAVGMGSGTVPYSPPQDDHAKQAGTSHHCDCGEGCQCVGCAAHPYNEATQNYVRSAWNSMNEESANGHRPYSNGTSRVASTEHSPRETTAASDIPTETNGNSNGNGTGPQTPSDAASGFSEEQTLSANDFFFVSYPFGDTCAGDTASCPCGDDCQCIGCAIHSNPDPSQPSQQTEG